jgi:hypothetical protein
MLDSQVWLATLVSGKVMPIGLVNENLVAGSV